MDIQKIIEEARLDPSLASNINIDKLLENIDNPSSKFLENKNIDQINQEIFHCLSPIIHSKPHIFNICKKLIGYRHVDEIYQLHKGKQVRWIRLDRDNYELSRGGIVVDIKFSDNGTIVLCRLFGPHNQYTQYLFNQCLTFQKLSEEELFMLSLNRHIST